MSNAYLPGMLYGLLHEATPRIGLMFSVVDQTVLPGSRNDAPVFYIEITDNRY